MICPQNPLEPVCSPLPHRPEPVTEDSALPLQPLRAIPHSDAFKGAFIAQSRCLQFIMVFQLWAGKAPGIEPVSVIYGQCNPNPIDTSHEES